MSELSVHDHEWAVRQLSIYSIGMLPEEQTLRLEEHLRDCGDCRARLAPLKRSSPADAGHLPASLIATWPRASRLLIGLERALVESHLSSCESCRATLAFAGHAAILSAVPASVPVRPVRGPALRRTWGWALGLSGAAATAAWLLMVHPALFPRAPHTSGTMGALSQRTSERGGFDLALPLSTPGAIVLPEPTPESAPLLLPAWRPFIGGLVLRVPRSLRPRSPEDGARGVTLTATRAGREFARQTCRWSELGEVLSLGGETRLPAGDYELRVSVDAATTSEPARAWRWVLRVR